MSKRFTETTKWDDPWYRKLSPKYKLLWQYMCDKCDNAGVWKIDFELASFCIGSPVNISDINKLNDGKVRVVIKENIAIIKDFIPYQIGNINADNLTNLQKSCKALVKNYLDKGIDVFVTGSLPVSYGLATGIGKGKGKGNIIKDRDNIIIIDIINDLNIVLGTKYRTDTDKTRKLIKARLEKFTIDDFKKVHRIKYAEWGDDPKMAKFLRPETLYGSKFESYLNQKSSNAKNGVDSWYKKRKEMQGVADNDIRGILPSN